MVWIIPDKLCSLQLQGCVVRKREGFSIEEETANYFPCACVVLAPIGHGAGSFVGMPRGLGGKMTAREEALSS